MKIALIGYGNMGQEIEKLVQENSKHEIVSISFRDKSGLDEKGIQKADVAIDFTSPEVVIDTIAKVAGLGVNLIVGTTGWYNELEKVKTIIKEKNIGLLYGGNFSVGANIFFNIVSYASKLFNHYEQYDVYGYEIHHKGKKDSPSGTAQKLADIMINTIASKKIIQTNRLDRQIKNDELHFASVRGGINRGRHTVIFDSMADEIELTHQAHGRLGFAEGALIAAEFIKNKKGIYRFDELFTEEARTK